MTTFKIIPTRSILVDDEYQRALDERWVAAREDRFDARLLGTLTVTPRNGHYTVIDGQHRLRLAQAVGVKEVPCTVVDTGDQADAANVFVAMNRERRGVKPIDIYRADLLAGNVTALAVRDVLDRWGFKMSGSKLDTSATITSVLAVRRAVKLYGPGVLDFALAVITDAWGKDSPNARRAKMLQGLFAVAIVYPDLSPTAFAARVGRKAALYYIQAYTAGANTFRLTGGFAVTDGAMAETLVAGYNAGLQTKRLDEIAMRVDLRALTANAGRSAWEARELERIRAEKQA